MNLQQLIEDHKKYELAELTNEQEVKQHGEYYPGCKATIQWQFDNNGDKWRLTDKGYCFELPGMDGEYYNDFFVHIPIPDGGEKGASDSVWIHINQLLQNKYVKKVTLK